MSDSLTVSVDAQGAVNLNKLFEGIVKVVDAATKLESKGKGLAEVRKIIEGLGNAGGGIAQLQNIIKNLNSTVQALPTQIATALSGIRTIGETSGKALGDGLASGLSGAKDKVKSEAAKIKAEAEKTQKELEEFNSKIRTSVEKARKESTSAYSDIASQTIKFGPLSRASSAPKLGEDDVRHLLGMPSRDEMKTFASQIKTQMTDELAKANLRVKSAPRMTEDDTRALLGMPDRGQMKSFAAQLKAQMAEDVANIQSGIVLRVKSASKMTLDDTRSMLGLPDRGEMKTFASQLKTQMQDDLAKSQAKVKSASKMTIDDTRALLGMPDRGEMKSFAAQLKAQMMDDIAKVNIKAKSASKMTEDDTRAMLGMPSRSEMKSFTDRLKAEMLEIEAVKTRVAKATQSSTAPWSNINTRAVVNAPDVKVLPKPVDQTHIDLMDKFGVSTKNANVFVRGLASGFGILQSSIGSMLPLLGGAGLAGLMVKMTSTGSEVEHTFQIIASLGGASSQSIAALNAELSQLAKTGPFSVQEIAGAMKTLSLAGLEANEILKVTKDVLNFSIAGTTTIEKAADTLVSVATAFGTGSDSFGRIGDVIAKTAAVSKASVESISESFKTASVINKQYGVSLEDVGVGLAALSNLGIQGTAAGVALRNMYVDLSGRTKQVNQILKEQHLDFRLMSGDFKDVITLVGQLNTAVSKMDGKGQRDFLQALASERGAKPLIEMLDLLRQAPKDVQAGFKNMLEELQAQIKNSYGLAAEAAVALNQTTQSQFKGMTASFGNALNEAFKDAQPALRIIFTSLRETFNNPEFIKGLSSLTTALATMAQVVIENAKIIGILTAAYVASRVALSLLNAVLEIRTASIVANTAVTAANASVVTASNTAINGTAAAAQAASGGMGLLMRSLGAINIVLGIGTAAWALYSYWKTKGTQEDAGQKAALKTIEDIKSEAKRQKDLADAMAGNQTKEQFERVAQSRALADKVRADTQSEIDSWQVKLDAARSRAQKFEADYAAYASVDTKRKMESEIDTVRKLTIMRDAATARQLKNVRDLKDATDDLEGEAKRVAAYSDKQARLNAPPVGTTPFERYKTGTNPKAAMAGEGAVQRAYERELADMKKAYDAQMALSQKAYSNQEQILKAKLSGQLISEAEYYVESLAQSIKYETDRAAIIESYRSKALSRINERKDQLESQVPGIANMGTSADDLAKLKPAVAMAVSEYQKLKSEMASVNVETDKASVLLKEEGDRRREMASINLAASLAKDSKGYVDLGRSIDVAIKKEKEKFAVAEGTGGKRADIEAKARIEAESAFQLKLQEREDVLQGLKDQQSLLNDQWFAFIASGNSKGAEEIAGQLAKVDDQIVKSTGSMTQLKAKMGELGNTAAMGAGEAYWKQTESALDGLIDKTQILGKAFEEGFGRGAKALVDVMQVFDQFGKKQTQIDAIRAKAVDAAAGDKKKLADIDLKTNAASERNTIEMYVSMASAAKGFFNEHSRGYKALAAAEQVYRAVTVVGNMAVAMSNAVVGITNQAKGDPYTAIPRMAAMAAIMAGLGVATGFFGSSTSGSTASAEARQGGAATGRLVNASDTAAGTVLGDENARSESIKNSLAALKDIDTIMLSQSAKMLVALQSIENSMAGLASLVARTVGLTTGKNLNIDSGKVYNAAGALGTTDPVLDLIRKINPGADILSKAFFGSIKKEVADVGLVIAGSIAQLASGQGVGQYADVNTTKSKFFGLSKSTSTATQFAELDPAIAEQFSLVFRNIGVTLETAAVMLGKDGAQVAQAIADFVVDIPRLSLKDLKGADLQAAIEAAIGSVSDSVAAAIIPGFKEFQKVGEGYFETIIRVASGVEQGAAVLDRFNISAISYTDIIQKQGDVAAEIVRQSIQAVESSGGVLNSIGEIVGTLQGSASEIGTTYQSLLDLRTSMKAVGFDAEGLSITLIKAAGGIDKLSTSLATYQDKYFTDIEKTTSLTTQLTEQFGELGYALPSSRDQLRDWIEGLNELDPAQAKTLAGLLALTGPFDTLATGLDKVADAAQAAADAAADLWAQLDDAIDSNIGKVLSPRAKIDYDYSDLAVDVQGAGFFPGVENLVDLFKNVSTVEIYDYVTEFLKLPGITTEAKIAMVNFAGSLIDIKDAENQLNINDIQSQIDAIDKLYGDLSVLEEPVLTLSEQFVQTRDKIKDLENGLAEMLGTVKKTSLEILGEMLAKQKELQEYRVGLKERIETTRLAGLSPADRVAALKAKETSLYSQLETTNDPVKVAQELEETIIDRIRLEAEIQQTAADQLAETHKKSLDEQITALEDQIALAHRLSDLAKSIKQFVSELKFSDMSPKSYQDQLGEAKALYDRTLAAAQAGDETAQGNLTANAKSYLDEARAYYASGSAYASIFNSVTGSLEQYAGTLPIDPQLDSMEKQLDELRKQSEQFDTLNNTTINTSAAEVAALTALDAAMEKREIADQAKIDKQIALIEAEIAVMKLINEVQADQIAQQKATRDELLLRLDALVRGFNNIEKKTGLDLQGSIL